MSTQLSELLAAIEKARGLISGGSSRLVGVAQKRAQRALKRLLRAKGSASWRRRDGAVVNGVNVNALRRALRADTLADRIALRVRGGAVLHRAKEPGKVIWRRRTGAYS